MQQIHITPEELMNLANQLSSEAETLNTQVSTLSGHVQSMTTAWKGMGANSYYNMYVQMEPDLRGFAALIESIAGSAKVAAQSFDSTDAELAKGFNG